MCQLERIRLDLGNVAARRELFTDLGKQSQRALIVTEGLLIYLTTEQVAELARDLAAPPGLRNWVLDLASPGLMQLIKKHLDPALAESGASLKFGPEEGPEFFAPTGWKPHDIRSLLKTAARLKRLTLWMRILSLLPESKGRQGNRPWAAVCLMQRTH
jgi:O-methyltransferase involved in polyketide biosynthesis